ncbi:MAG: di-heme oxidoredictase family protein, partial [Pseudomonadota bacterium]
GVTEIEGYLASLPEPTYGAQIQDFGIAGHGSEARLEITYEELKVVLSGGEIASLRKPIYTLSNLGYGPIHPEVMMSPRVAPQMIGLGLLDAVPASDILANADPHDLDEDGISGRAQIVISREYGVPMLGRFGLKAGQPSIWEQSAAAFHGDIGISSTLFPAGAGECSERQTACGAAPDGNTPAHDNAEISDQSLGLVSFYASNLAVPARREVDDPYVLHGKRVFYETGCISCHTPKFVTHRLSDQPEQSFQLIWPYTDMLLHDMGPGLADNRPEARANGQEWRTPPLWGIGLTETVSGHTYFLHDGRARSLLEAVLWHGGEAEPQKQRVIEMPPEDRGALIRFLESL